MMHDDLVVVWLMMMMVINVICVIQKMSNVVRFRQKFHWGVVCC